MSKTVQFLVLACLVAVATPALPGKISRAAEVEKGAEEGTKRAALWQALLKALPDTYSQIDAYAENPSLSQVLFRSQGTTLTFSLQTGKVEPVLHMKALPRINRITFEQHQSGSLLCPVVLRAAGTDCQRGEVGRRTVAESQA